MWLGFVGACIGSFLNVVAYRMPLGMSVIWKPSHCPKCSHPIRAYDNVPVLGWLWLKGRCRDCGEPISPRYAVVELIMGLAFFLLAYRELFSGGANLPGGPLTEFTGAIQNVWEPRWGLLGIYAFHGLLLSLLMSLVLMSLDSKQAPLKLVVFGMIVGVAAPLLWPHLNPPASPTETLDISVAFFKALCLSAGGLLGTLLWGREFWSGQLPWEGCRRNLYCMLILVFSFLGWQALLSLSLFAFGLAATWRLASMWGSGVPAPRSEVSLWTACLLLFMVWHPWSALWP